MKPIEKIYRGKIIGHYYEFHGGMAFFGNKDGTTDILHNAFPGYEWLFVRQIHGNQIVEAGGNQEADAHWTRKKHLALCIRTADCIPLLIKSEQGTIMAVHAGWRGIESTIIMKALDFLASKGIAAQSLQSFVGPHILQENFEVGLDVAERLVQVSGSGKDILFAHKNPNKKFVDLLRIVLFQLEPTKPPLIFFKNTFGDPEYHSYRENHAKGRQVSFIVQH